MVQGPGLGRGLGLKGTWHLGGIKVRPVWLEPRSRGRNEDRKVGGSSWRSCRVWLTGEMGLRGSHYSEANEIQQECSRLRFAFLSGHCVVEEAWRQAWGSSWRKALEGREASKEGGE